MCSSESNIIASYLFSSVSCIWTSSAKLRCIACLTIERFWRVLSLHGTRRVTSAKFFAFFFEKRTYTDTAAQVLDLGFIELVTCSAYCFLRNSWPAVDSSSNHVFSLMKRCFPSERIRTMRQTLFIILRISFWVAVFKYKKLSCIWVRALSWGLKTIVI